MDVASYEFDPCALDGSDKEEEVTLDNWKPSKDKPKIVPSQWRQQQIGNNFNQQPGMDELQKIHAALNKRASDAEIMYAFGITAETLVAIKKDKYDPVDGISLDNQSKIYKEFKRQSDKIESLLRAINFIGFVLFIEKDDLLAFKKSFRKPKKATSTKKSKSEVIEEACEESEDI